MKVNPVADAWTFLIGATGDQQALGAARYLFVLLFLVLLAVSVAIARANWRADPAQRSAVHLWTWLFRVLIGVMGSKARCGSCPFRSRARCNTGPSRWPSTRPSRSTQPWCGT